MPPIDPSIDPTQTIDQERSLPTKTLPDTLDESNKPPVDNLGSATSLLPVDVPTIPGYRILAEIARGGMGRVYAGQELALDREVAIKTLLPGANAERFVTESKITAKLPHPAIPPVYALGTLEDGTPYLAMKLIRGRTLAELLRERSRPTDELSRYLQIFEQIAQAVGFAHSRGIIHRDLKPLNVMVGEFGEVQVMDWGLAKEQSKSASSESAPANLAEDAQLTIDGVIMGTPSYMAPEQARGEIVDARADVFALGSILATILTGQPAFVGQNARETVALAANAVLTDVFARLDACEADGELVALARHCLAPAREDRPANAQAVAAEVAAYRSEVENRLRQAETEAAEALVRVAEQRKRRRLTLVAASVVTVVLLVGIVGTAIGLMRANTAAEQEREAKTFAQGETRRAEENADKERQARRQADQEKTIALAVREFLQNRLIRQANPYENSRLSQLFNDGQRKGAGEQHAPSRDLTVRELLDQAAKDFSPDTVAAKFPEQPLVQAEILQTIGETYEGLKEFGKSVPYMQAAHALRVKHLGPTDPVSLASQVNLIFTYLAAGRLTDTVQSMNDIAILLEGLVKEVPEEVAARQEHPVLKKLDAVLNRIFERANPDSFAYKPIEISLVEGAFLAVQGPILLGRVSRLQEQFQQRFGREDPRCIAIDLWLAFGMDAMGQSLNASHRYEAIVAKAEKLLPSDSRLLDGLREVLLVSYVKTGRERDRWLPMLTQQYESKLKRNGPEHPSTSISLANLAWCYAENRRFDEAIRHWEKARKAREPLFGPEHPDTFTILNYLARAYQGAGRVDEAINLLEQVRKSSETKFGSEHRQTLVTQYNLAGAYRDANRLDEAITLYEQVRKAEEANFGAEHPDTLTTQHDLAGAYRDAGRFDEAIKLFEQVRKARETKLGSEHPHTLSTLVGLGLAYFVSEQWEKSASVFRELIPQQRKRLKANDPELGEMIALGGLSALKARQFDEAEPLLREALAIREKAQPTAWSTFNAQSMLGGALLGQKKYAEAEPLLLRGYAGIKQRLATIPAPARPRVPEAVDRLISLYEALNKPDEVAKWRKERELYPSPPQPDKKQD